MKETVLNSYEIQITDSKLKCISANGERGHGFLYPDVSDNMPKLYVVKHSRDIYYVGITRQDIRKRLRYGFTAKGEHGYYGYKWKKQNRAELLVWSFPGRTNEHVEAIEAELVYFIREKTGEWPRYQMEIHFHGASDEEKQIAKSMLNQCLEK